MPDPIHASITSLQLRLYKLTTKSHLRIGAGEGSIALSAADNPVIQALFYTPPPSGNGSGEQERVIYLPGSSLHGVIRAWSEKALRSAKPFLTEAELKQHLEAMGDQGEEWLDAVCDEVGKGLGVTLEPSDARLYEHWRVHPTVCDPLSLTDQCQRFGEAAEGQQIPAKQAWFSHLGRANPCPVCQVFGYVGQRGRVRVHHAYAAKGGTPLDIITRVAINRISGAADEHKLFDMEAIPPGAQFYFYVVLENLSDDQRKVFERGVRALQLQLATLGAHSTVGFGAVELEPVMQATLAPQLFDETDLPKTVQQVVRSHKLHGLAAGLDADRYPSFFRALAMVDEGGKSPAAFGPHVQVHFGAG